MQNTMFDLNTYTYELSALCCYDSNAYAVVELDGCDQIISFIQAGDIISYESNTKLGKATTYISQYVHKGFACSLKLELGSNKQFVFLQGKIQNQTGKAVKLKSFVLCDCETATFKKDSLVTPLLEMTHPEYLKDYNCNMVILDGVAVFPKAGDGVLIGAVGPGVAYGNISLSETKLKISTQMDGIIVDHGEVRESEKMLLLCGDSRYCVETWADMVAKGVHARTHRGAIDGWCSWYDQTTGITEKHVREIVDVYQHNSDIFHPAVVQIDDGYQRYDGDWSANTKFPSGLKTLAKDIKNSGFIPGKWVAPLIVNDHIHNIETVREGIRKAGEQEGFVYMDENPFHPLGAMWLDPTHPASKVFLGDVMKKTVEEGFEYIKIDFNDIGSVFYNKKKTQFEVMKELFALYREYMGEGMYFLACTTKPSRATIGSCDAERIGPDSHPGGIDNALAHTLRFQYCHDVWWANDPDVTYLKNMVEGRWLGATQGGEAFLQTWHNAIAISCGLAMTSEPLNVPDAKDSWRTMEILTPPAKEKAVLYDFCRSKSTARFGFTARRAYGDFSIVMLWNDQKEETTVSIDTTTLELPSGKIAVYSFWDNEVVGVYSDRYTTPMMQPQHSQQLRITPIDKTPQIIGSNLHLSCGAAEITNFEFTENEVVISLNEAGARSGSIFVYSLEEIEKVSSVGMDTALRYRENHIYEVMIQNRERYKDKVYCQKDYVTGNGHNVITLKLK